MKTIIKIFICISLIYTPFFAFAGAAEKWEILENNYDHTKNTVNVTAKKITQDAANSGVYKVQVPVNPSTLGSTVKMMLKGGVASAALYGLVEGVGWIIDEGSKTIKKPTTVQPSTAYQFIWQGYAGQTLQTFNSPDEFRAEFERLNPKYVYVSQLYEIISIDVHRIKYTYKVDQNSTSTVTPAVVRSKNPYYIPETMTYTEVSDSQLGSEIIGNGKNTTPVPEIITDAYSPNNPVSDAPAPKETNTALDSATPQPETPPTSETKPNPNSYTNGDGVPDTFDSTKPSAGESTTWPPACDWFPAACEFFKVQKQDNKEIKENQKTDIAQNQSFFDEVKDWFTWSKENDDLPDDEKPQISEIPTPELKEDAIRWSAQCPADAQVPINMQGVSSTITFSWSPWCQLLDMIKPAIIASAYIGAAFIVLGLRT